MPRPDRECVSVSNVTVTVTNVRTTTVTPTTEESTKSMTESVSSIKMSGTGSSGKSTGTGRARSLLTTIISTLTTVTNESNPTTCISTIATATSGPYTTQPPWMHKGTVYCCPNRFTYNDCLRTSINQAYCTQGATVSSQGVTFPDPLTVMTSETIQIVHYGNARASLLVLINEDGLGNRAFSNSCSGSSGLSTIMKISIGLCVPLAIVIIIAVFLGFTWYRRKKLHNSFPPLGRTPKLEASTVKVSELDNTAEIRQMGHPAESWEMVCAEGRGNEWAKMAPVELP